MHAAPAPVASNRRQRLLATLLERAGLKSADRIPRRSGGLDRAPLSSGQQRLWFLDRLAPGNPVYNVPTCFRIRGPLDLGAFQHALNEIVRRHETLRTTFEIREDAPVQVIAEQRIVRATVVDAQGRSEPALRELAIDEAGRPFNLAQGPLIRVVLFRLSEHDHLVLITMHHIICDGWSIGVLFRELSALYAGAIRRTPANLPELAVQFADYAAWERARLDGGNLAAQVDYWRDHLRGAPTMFELPTDLVRPQDPTFRGAVVHTLVDQTVSEVLLELAQAESTTPFVLLLAAYAVFLSRYSGQDDFIIGCPVSNRNRTELEPLISFLPNTLPFRMQTQGDPSFLTLLRSLRETAAKAFANAEAPFDVITDAVASTRSGHNTLFQVAFMMQEKAPSRVIFGDVEITPVDLDLGTAKCDLTLVGAKGPEGLSFALEYSADLFKPDTIRRMIDHFKTLLEGIASNPAERISALALMSPQEEQQMLVDWAGTSRTETDHRAMHTLFEEHAVAQPNAPALIFGSQTITYAELNERANRIANELMLCGAGPGALVAIALKRSPDLIAAILGVLKSGAAYLPVALDHPADRISLQIEDANPMMIITTSDDRRSLPPAVQKLAWLAIPLPDGRGSERGAESRPSDIAYVIYTSGSTGKPKGVMIEHRGLTNLAMAQQQLFRLGPGCRVLQFAPPTFDASVWEIAMTMSSGACLCLGSGAAFVPDELARVLREQRVTTVTLPPSLLRTLTPADFPELHTVISAGEDCPEALAREWSKGRTFFNAYGPTETTVCATALKWEPWSQKITIGRVLPNVRTYILDSNMRPVPAGVPGELHVGGAGVARGYLNRPELTRARFIQNPFGQGRLYKTGDLARYLPNGEIEFMGRIDGQVKLRGHRIEPGEIEAHLETHPAMHQCAVVLRQDAGKDALLVAFFVPRGLAPTNEELRDFAAKALPQYMVPSAFVPLPDLPVNSSGKIDRRALSLMEIVTERRRVEARDDLESTIAQIWAEVLRAPSVGITDNFFELGGNSLTAVNLIAKITARTGCDLPVTTLFQASTVEQLARRIRESRNRSSTPGSVVRLQPLGSKPPLVLIPPAGGGLICYSDLARMLAPDQPVLGVEPVRDAESAASVEALAARYVRELRSVELNGPLRLAGWSFGGNVAFEMARQLAEQGRAVDLILLLDSHARHKGKEPRDDEILLEIARVRELAGIAPETMAREVRTIVKQFRANMRAARRYAPGHYGGRVALLRTSDTRWPGDYGWSRYCARLEVHDIPGEHRTLLAQPHATRLAAILRERFPWIEHS